MDICSGNLPLYRIPPLLGLACDSSLARQTDMRKDSQHGPNVIIMPNDKIIERMMDGMRSNLPQHTTYQF